MPDKEINLDPFAFARGDDENGDAKLVELEAKIRACDGRFDDDMGDEQGDALCHEQYEYIERLNTTPPTTVAGVVAKLRVLAHPDYGMEAGDRDDDLVSLRQVLALLESRQGDDAERLALIEEYRKRELAAGKLGISDDERARRCDLAREVLDQINSTRPTTLAGVLAVLDLGGDIEDPHHWPDEAIEGLRAIVERPKD